MIRINSFLHRQKLLDITHRWFFNRLEPGDLPLLKALINFNSIWIGRVGKDFATRFFHEFTGVHPTGQKIGSKGDFKDLLIESPHYENARIRTLIRRYQERPERYFRETPFAGVAYQIMDGGKPTFVGSTRIKRVRRISEKGGRRVTNFIFEEIKEMADTLALQRADALGITKAELITSHTDMENEFERAEHHIEMEISRGSLFHRRMEFILEDVLGAKVVAEDDQQDRVLQILKDNPACQILEVEHHRGRYNGTNVVFRYSPSKDELLQKPLEPSTLSKLESCGMEPDTLEDEFRQFVLSGEESIHIELIMSTYQELLESEIGRSMHEERILQQRLKQNYRGHLGRNVGYLMEYIFACAISPRKEIEQLPLIIWNRYMPDYFDEVLKDLFHIPSFREIE